MQRPQEPPVCTNPSSVPLNPRWIERAVSGRVAPAAKKRLNGARRSLSASAGRFAK